MMNDIADACLNVLKAVEQLHARDPHWWRGEDAVYHYDMCIGCTDSEGGFVDADNLKRPHKDDCPVVTLLANIGRTP